MNPLIQQSVVACLCALTYIVGVSDAQAFSPEQIDFFEREVRPILVARCIECHGPDKQESGLRLDSRAAILKGGLSGEAAVPGQLESSLLLSAVHYQDYEMPPAGKLPSGEIAVLEQWVAMNLPWPEASASLRPLTLDEKRELDRREHWAFQPIADPPVPRTDDPWIQNDIDRFVLARLKSAGLSPSPAADKLTLIRRATFDLHGLPPTPQEVDAFVQDESPDAYKRLIDRLLDSPRYGEKWGRRWLDVARYSDTLGYATGGRDRRYPYAYTYRDYVVDALNQDKPYNEFIKEQLAADYFASDGDRRLAALGFLRVGRQFLKTEETRDDQIDVVTRGLLGLTVSCARCHDHKYDAISMADYYGLYGIFDNMRATEPLIDGASDNPHYADFQRELAKRQQELDDSNAKLAATIRGEASQAFFDHIIRVVSNRPEAELGKYPQNELKPTNVRPNLVRAWRVFLDQFNDQDPVWGPLVQVRALGDEKFKQQRDQLFKHWRSDESLNARLREKLAESRPATLADVVHMYDDLLDPIGAAWLETLEVGSAVQQLDGAERELAKALLGRHSPIRLDDAEVVRSVRRDERNRTRKLESRINALETEHPGAPPRAMAVEDPSKIDPAYIFLRGNRGSRGDQVPRRFIRVVSTPNDSNYQRGSGRLELAEDIVHPANPLTARVLVNRVWLGHFDRPLVTTPGDFGVRSDPPSHPLLLDHLATRFTQNGWSLKQLHRDIMLSATYRQQSVDRPDMRAIDPENRLLWKMNRRRLTFEETRDSILAVSGSLDATIGGRSVKILEPPFPPRRTMYGLVDRQDLPNLYRAFDFPSPDSSSPQRSKTTVPQQALFLMNSQLVQQQAGRIAETVLSDPDLGDVARIERLYRIILQRPPSDEQRELFAQYIAAAEGDPKTKWSSAAQALLVSNQFMFVD